MGEYGGILREYGGIWEGAFRSKVGGGNSRKNGSGEALSEKVV